MAPLAKMFKDMGWEVSGSDHHAYPPNTDYLEKNQIPYFNSFNADHIKSDIDLVVIGGIAYHVGEVNPEVDQAREFGLKVQSYPEVFHEYLEKPESIVVIGTYGKTTICALLAWILETAGLNPSFDIAEITENFPDGTRNTESQYSIIHGDEHPTLGYSDLPKFAYFSPKYLLLTTALWDHFNIYPTEEKYFNVFKQRIINMPRNGLVLMKLAGEHNQELAKYAPCPVYTYSLDNPQADFYVEIEPHPNSPLANLPAQAGGRKSSLFDKEGAGGSSTNTISNFDFIEKKSGKKFTIEFPMLGKHNLENAVAAIAMATVLGVKPEPIQKAMKSFKGLKRHLELIFENQKVHIYKDQGQHPQKFKAAIDTLKDYYPDQRLIVILDPHASVLHDINSLKFYDHTLDKADMVIIGMIKIRKLKQGESKQDRVTGRRIRNAIQKTQPKVKYLPVDRQILKWLKENSKAGDALLFLTTGSFRNLVQDAVEIFKKP